MIFCIFPILRLCLLSWTKKNASIFQLRFSVYLAGQMPKYCSSRHNDCHEYLCRQMIDNAWMFIFCFVSSSSLEIDICIAARCMITKMMEIKYVKLSFCLCCSVFSLILVISAETRACDHICANHISHNFSDLPLEKYIFTGKQT